MNGKVLNKVKNLHSLRSFGRAKALVRLLDVRYMQKFHILILGLLLTSCGPASTGSKPDTQKVDNNQFVILKDKDSYGVFKLFDQIDEPETAKYEWSLFERNPHEGSLNKIKTGDGFTGHDPIGLFSFYNDVPIEFGPFRLKWSINSTDRGWVYFKGNNTDSEQSYCIATDYRVKSIESLIATCKFKVMPR